MFLTFEYYWQETDIPTYVSCKILQHEQYLPISNIPIIGGSSNAILPTDRQCDIYCNLGHIGGLLATYWHAWNWDYYWQEGRRAGAGNMARCLSFGFGTCLSIIPYLPIHINCHYDIFLNIMNTFLIHSSSWWLISYFA